MLLNKEIYLGAIDDSPHKRLIAAVIRRAIDDLFLPFNANATEMREKIRRDAYEYIFLDQKVSGDYEFSFSRCCNAMNLDVGSVRDAVRKRYEEFLSSNTPIKEREGICLEERTNEQR